MGSRKGWEQTIQSAWQRKTSFNNGWNNLNSKLYLCSRELLKWDAKKKKMSKQELEDKISSLKILHSLNPPNTDAIKSLEKEIDLWLEQDDVKWRQRAKKEWYKGVIRILSFSKYVHLRDVTTIGSKASKTIKMI